MVFIIQKTIPPFILSNKNVALLFFQRHLMEKKRFRAPSDGGIAQAHLTTD